MSKPTYEELVEAVKDLLMVAKEMAFNEEDLDDLSQYEDLLEAAQK